MLFEKTMRVVCGLGNPGALYANTRHNAGFMVVDHFVEKHNLSWGRPKDGIIVAKHSRDVLVAKPDAFMNTSGPPIGALLRYYKVALSDFLLVVDCVSLEPGIIRLSRNGSHAGQNGVRSVIENLGSKDFPRLRIGVGRGKTRSTVLADHVLSTFGPGIEQDALKSAIRRATDAIDCFLLHGVDKAMNDYN